MRTAEGDWARHVEKYDGIRVHPGRPRTGDNSLSSAEQIVLRLMDPLGNGWSLPATDEDLRKSFNRAYENRVEIEWVRTSDLTQLSTDFGLHESCPACDLARDFARRAGRTTPVRPEEFWPHRVRPIRPADNARWDLLRNGRARLEARGAVEHVDDAGGVRHWYVTPKSQTWTREWHADHESFLSTVPGSVRAELVDLEERHRLLGEQLITEWRAERHERKVWLAGQIVSGIRRTEREAAWKRGDAAREAAYRRDLERIRKRVARSSPVRKAIRAKTGETAESLMLELDAISREILSRAPNSNTSSDNSEDASFE